MSFTEAISSCFSQYTGFSGRARRSEYWYFCLLNLIVSGVLSAIAEKIGFQFLPGIWTLAVFLPSLAVTLRRLHDIGKSGWFYLLIFIPCVGTIILIYFLVQDSQPGENQWGPNPKGNSTIF